MCGIHGIIASNYNSIGEKINMLKRCSKCLLSETFPFIEFDEKGECYYCRYYNPISCMGLDAFSEYIKQFHVNTNAHDCLLPFSGGRDFIY